jgi:hypothetical protein
MERQRAGSLTCCQPFLNMRSDGLQNRASITQCLLFEADTSYYSQLPCRSVRKRPVRIVLPSSNQRDREVVELACSPNIDPVFMRG